MRNSWVVDRYNRPHTYISLSTSLTQKKVYTHTSQIFIIKHDRRLIPRTSLLSRSEKSLLSSRTVPLKIVYNRQNSFLLRWEGKNKISNWFDFSFADLAGFVVNIHARAMENRYVYTLSTLSSHWLSRIVRAVHWIFFFLFKVRSGCRWMEGESRAVDDKAANGFYIVFFRKCGWVRRCLFWVNFA